MRILVSIIAGLLVAGSVVSAGADSRDAVRQAIAAAVTERIPSASSVDVQLESVPDLASAHLSAAPVPGARLGKAIRFVITPRDGRPFTVVADVSVVAGHTVATRAVPRGATLTAEDVEWREGSLEDVLVEALPALDQVLAAQARRALAADEVLTQSVIAPALAVRAGDLVTVVVRSGLVEARGVGRAVSSGSIGEVIRVTAPGSRDARRARIVAPASVEVLP